MTRHNILLRFVFWLRAGYPQGVPQGDYVALLGILHRELTTEEIEAVVRRLRADSAYPAKIPESQIRKAIHDKVKEQPSDGDVARVRARLEAVGWPAAPDKADNGVQPDGGAPAGAPPGVTER